MLAEKVSNFKSPIFRMLSKVALCTNGQSLDADGGLNAIRNRLASLRRSRSLTAAIPKYQELKQVELALLVLWLFREGGHKDPSESRLWAQQVTEKIMSLGGVRKLLCSWGTKAPPILMVLVSRLLRRISPQTSGVSPGKRCATT